MHHELNVALAHGFYYVDTRAPCDEQLNDPSARAICLGDCNKQLRMNGGHVADRLRPFPSSTKYVRIFRAYIGPQAHARDL